MSTTFFDSTSFNVFNAFTVIDLCSGASGGVAKGGGSTFTVSLAGQVKIDTVKLGVSASSSIGTTWTFNVGIYNVGVGNTVGTLVGNLITGATFTTTAGNQNTAVIDDLTSTITPVTVTGSTRYWLIVTDPTSTGFQWNTVAIDGTDHFPGEYTADCAPLLNAVTNTPFIMLVGGSVAATPPSPSGTVNIPLAGSFGQTKSGYGINQKIIQVPEMNTFDEVRQVLARVVGELQNHIATQLPIVNYKQNQIKNVAPPTEGDDVVTLKYLQSVQLPPQPK